jgi:hypothetical protein
MIRRPITLACLALSTCAAPALAQTDVRTGCYRCVDDNKTNPSGRTISNFDWPGTQHGVILEKGHTIGLTLTDGVIRGAKPVRNSLYPTGLFLKRGRDFTAERVTIRDVQTIPDKKYRQGDCVDAENGFVGITLRYVTLLRCTDGGLDSKGQDVLLDHVTAAENKINYRLWFNVHRATTIISENPKSAHIQTNSRQLSTRFAAGGLDADVVVFRSTNTAPLLHLDAGSSVRIGRCVIDVPAGTRVIAWHNKGRASNVTLTLGEGCAADAKGFAVNTPIAAAALPGLDLGEVLPDTNGDGLIKLSNKKADQHKLPRGTVLRALGGTRYEVVL